MSRKFKSSDRVCNPSATRGGPWDTADQAEWRKLAYILQNVRAGNAHSMLRGRRHDPEGSHTGCWPRLFKEASLPGSVPAVATRDNDDELC